MPGPVEDRLRLLRATAHAPLPDLRHRIADPCPPSPRLLDRTLYADARRRSCVDEEGVTHRSWEVSRAMSRSTTGSRDEDLLIADGHHRYTTALAYRDERHAADGPGPWDRDPCARSSTRAPRRCPCCPTTACRSRARPRRRQAERRRDLDEVAGAGVGRQTSSSASITRRDGRTLCYGAARPAMASPPVRRALHEQVLDRRAPGDALRFTHERARRRRARSPTGTPIAAYLLPPTTPARVLRRDRARRSPPPQVDLLLAEAPDRHAVHAACADRDASSGPRRLPGRAS